MTTPIPFEDARWQRLMDAAASGQALQDSDLHYLATYRPFAPEVRAEAELLRCLAEGPNPDADAVGDRQMIALAVDQFVSETPAARRWLIPSLVGGFAVAAAVLLAVVLPADDGDVAYDGSSVMAAADRLPSEVPEVRAATSEAAAVEEEDEITIIDEDPPLIAVLSGSLQPKSGATLRDGGTFVVDSDEPACLGHGPAKACFGRNAEVRLDTSVGRPRLDVVRGRAEVSFPQGPKAWVFDVAVGAYRVEPRADTVFEVRVETVENVEVRVRQGAVVVVDGKERHTVSAGQLREMAPATKPVRSRSGRSLDADELLVRARRLRGQGDVRGAIRSYESLIRSYSRSSAAKTSFVVLGQLYLQRGRAKSALRVFDKYLAAGGTELREEAVYGRIRALRALNRTSDARRATERFLTRYPSSSYAAKLRRQASK